MWPKQMCIQMYSRGCCLNEQHMIMVNSITAPDLYNYFLINESYYEGIITNIKYFNVRR